MPPPPPLSVREAFGRFADQMELRFPAFRRVVSRDLGIDLGTVNTLVYAAGKGIVVDQPSVVAIDQATGKIRAVGERAKQMLGRTPDSIRTVFPLREGVIADFKAAESMLRFFIKRALQPRGLVQPRVVISVPSCTTPVERRAVRQSAELAGAREVYLVDETMAAAIGARLPVESPRGSFVVDVGGGTTEVAVLALGGTVCARSSRVGGNVLDEAILQHLKRKHNLLVGSATAEMVKISVGSAIPADETRKHVVRGRDLVQGIPRAVEVSSDEIYEALQEPLLEIVRLVSEVLEATPPELSADVVDTGVLLTGGGALLWGLDELIAERTGLAVTVADQPLHAAVVGCGLCLANLPLLKQLTLRSK